MSGLTRQTASSAAAPLSYTGAFNDEDTAAVAARVIFTPAQNVNGAYVELISAMMDAGSSQYSRTDVKLIAKAGAPASSTDGDVIFQASTGKTVYGTVTVNSIPQNIHLVGRIKIAAGKGLYLNQTTGTAQAEMVKKSVLYTLL